MPHPDARAKAQHISTLSPALNPHLCMYAQLGRQRLNRITIFVVVGGSYCSMHALAGVCHILKKLLSMFCTQLCMGQALASDCLYLWNASVCLS